MSLKRRLLLLGTTAPAAPAGGTPVSASHGSMDNTTGTDANITTTSDIAAGSLVIFSGGSTLNRSLSTITDPSGDTWTKASAYAPNSANQLFCAWKIASAAMPSGTVITATLSGSCQKNAVVRSITNMDPAQSVVQGTGAFATGTAPAASVTPANASDVVLGIVFIDTGSADTFTLDAAFGDAVNRVGVNHGFYTAIDLPGSTSPLTKTDSNSASRVWLARAFAFKVA